MEGVGGDGRRSGESVGDGRVVGGVGFQPKGNRIGEGNGGRKSGWDAVGSAVENPTRGGE